jgi:hypothetical protein
MHSEWKEYVENKANMAANVGQRILFTKTDFV